jgi:hypothetical protein
MGHKCVIYSICTYVCTYVLYYLTVYTYVYVYININDVFITTDPDFTMGEVKIWWIFFCEIVLSFHFFDSLSKAYQLRWVQTNIQSIHPNMSCGFSSYTVPNVTMRKGELGAFRCKPVTISWPLRFYYYNDPYLKLPAFGKYRFYASYSQKGLSTVKYAIKRTVSAD